MSCEKPPLGLMPFYVHRHERMSEILEAMTRYLDSGHVIPNEWIWELGYHAESQRKEKQEKESMNEAMERLSAKLGD